MGTLPLYKVIYFRNKVNLFSYTKHCRSNLLNSIKLDNTIYFRELYFKEYKKGISIPRNKFCDPESFSHLRHYSAGANMESLSIGYVSKVSSRSTESKNFKPSLEMSSGSKQSSILSSTNNHLHNFFRHRQHNTMPTIAPFNFTIRHCRSL